MASKEIVLSGKTREDNARAMRRATLVSLYLGLQDADTPANKQMTSQAHETIERATELCSTKASTGSATAAERDAAVAATKKAISTLKILIAKSAASPEIEDAISDVEVALSYLY